MNDRFYCMGRHASTILSADWPDVPHIWISFSDPEEENVPVLDNPNRLGLIRFKVHDVEHNYPGGIKFTQEMAKQLYDFYCKHKDQAMCIIANCEAGVSRSAGVIEALNIIETQGKSLKDVHGPQFPMDEKDFIESTMRRKIYPNQLIKKLIISEHII